MIFKRLNRFSFLFLLLMNVAFGQQPKLMLPVGHTHWIRSAEFSPNGKRIVTASSDGTAKIWDATSGKLIANLKGHISKVNSAQFSSDGKKIVTASDDNTAKIWDAVSGNLIADLKGHTHWVNSAQFSPEGKKIVTASDDGTAKIWDATSGKLIADLKGYKSKVNSAQFSPDGKKILTTSRDYTAKIWDAASGNIIITLSEYKSPIYSAQFSPEGKKIVTASGDVAKIWDVASGNHIADLKGHVSYINSAHFSPDGKKIVTSSRDSTVKIWDAASGNIITDLKEFAPLIYTIQFSPDGEKIVTVSWDTAKIWDATSGKLIANLKGHVSNINTAQFSPDGKKIVTGSWDATAKIWDAASGRLVIDLKGQAKNVELAQFSPDGGKIATAYDDSSAVIWNALSGNLITDLKGHTGLISIAEFSPDGKKIVTASNGDGNNFKIWDAVSGKLIADLKWHVELVRSIQFSPDGKKIATASNVNIARIWDANTGNLIIDLKGHVYGLSSAQFSPDGKKIVTASADNTAKIWDANTGNLTTDLKGHMETVQCAQFSPDGKKIVTASDDHTAKIWDVVSGMPIADLKESFGLVNIAKFSPDGKKIITASDNEVRLWNAETGSLVTDLKGHKNYLCSVEFSLNGKRILTSSADNTTKVWEASTGTLLFNLKDFTNEIKSAHFSADSKKIMTISEGNTAKILNAETGKLLYSFFAVNSTDYLIVDSLNHYDGTEAARKLLYFTCGIEVIELDQVKDQLWVPNLAERIMKGDTINAKTLDQLNICGLTPEVEDGSSKADEYYFKITPRRGGLGETVLYVNGIEARRYKPAELKKNAGVYELVIKKADLKNLFVTGKENLVTVKAYTSDNAISSRGLIIKEDKTKEVSTPPNLYAVMIGVSDYKGDELDLKYADKDATDISAAVSNAAKKLLNTDGKEHVFMYNLTTAKEHYQLPEKNSIKKILEEIGKKSTANDILLIFFAGHGVMQGEKKQFYFLTADASKSSALDAIVDVGISTAELTEWMKPQNIKAQKRILIFDACNSGQAIRDFVKLGKEDQGYLAARNDDKAQQIKAIDKLNEKSGLFILSASASNQNAYEMGRYSQGLLTYSLLKAIKQQPDILEDGKYLNVSRWFNAAEKTVSDLSKENGARQEPQIVSNTNFNIGVVDDEVMAKIVLPQEKPLFAASNFQNGDENVLADDLGLNKLTDQELNEISARGTEATITYAAGSNSPDAYTLSGRYTVIGNAVSIKVIIRKNNEIKQRLELTGTKDKLTDLAKSIAVQAADWAAKNK